MKQLSNKDISNWKQAGSKSYHPSCISTYCPSCSKFVSFLLQSDWQQLPKSAKINASPCPACNVLSLFFLLDFKARQDKELSSEARLFIDSHGTIKEPNDSIINSSLPDPVKDAYISNIRIFNLGDWSASAGSTRRLLEGVVKSKLTTQYPKLNLYQLIEKLAHQENMPLSLVALANKIKDSGNLGAHFDLASAPNKEVCTLMLKLTEDMIEYFFVLPDRIDSLQQQIDQIKV